jgi:putative sigma-54 modulation protein
MHSSAVDIVFRNIPPSEALESRILEAVERLDALGGRIAGCRVVVAVPCSDEGDTAATGRYFVRIDLHLPDGEVVVGREPEDQRVHRDPDVALRDAFAAAERLLRARD